MKMIFSFRRIWPKALSIFKALTITVVIGLVSDYTLKFLDIETWEKFSTKAETFNTVLLDNAKNLNPIYILSLAGERIKTNRYHPSVWNAKAPFNVTEICQNRPFVFVPNTGLVNMGSYQYQGPPLPYNCELSESANPHQFWEYPLAFPDVFLSMLRTIWGEMPAETERKFGRDYPVQVPVAAQIIPWVCRVLLLLGILIALLDTIITDQKNKLPLGKPFFFAFLDSLVAHLFLISIGAFVLYGVMNLVLWVGQQDNQIAAATGGLGTFGAIVKSYYDEIKSLVFDTTKEKIGDQFVSKKSPSASEPKA